MADRAYTDAELDAAIAAISDPARLRQAQDVVMRTAPALQRVLAVALDEGGWFDPGHDQAVRDATGRDDPGDRAREVRTLLAEETRLGMLVGVAIGFELAQELGGEPSTPSPGEQTTSPPAGEQTTSPPAGEQTTSPRAGEQTTQED